MIGPAKTLNCDPDQSGRDFLQHQRMDPSYDYDAPNSIRAIPRDTLLEHQPDFGTCIIEPQCHLTDFVSSAPLPPWGLFVSAKLKTLLGRFSLPTHRFYQLRVVHGGDDARDFFWIHLPQPDLTIPTDATTSEAENLIRTHQELANCDLVSLYVPSRYAYTFASAPLVARIVADGITGVRFGTPRLFRTGG